MASENVTDQAAVLRKRMNEIQMRAYEVAAAVGGVWALLGDPESPQQEDAHTLLNMVKTHAENIADMANQVELANG